MLYRLLRIGLYIRTVQHTRIYIPRLAFNVGFFFFFLRASIIYVSLHATHLFRDIFAFYVGLFDNYMG